MQTLVIFSFFNVLVMARNRLEGEGMQSETRNLERSCSPCGDAIRDAVGRLEKFLKSKGYHPNIPRQIDQSAASRRTKCLSMGATIQDE